MSRQTARRGPNSSLLGASAPPCLGCSTGQTQARFSAAPCRTAPHHITWFLAQFSHDAASNVCKHAAVTKTPTVQFPVLAEDATQRCIMLGPRPAVHTIFPSVLKNGRFEISFVFRLILPQSICTCITPFIIVALTMLLTSHRCQRPTGAAATAQRRGTGATARCDSRYVFFCFCCLQTHL